MFFIDLLLYTLFSLVNPQSTTTDHKYVSGQLDVFSGLISHSGKSSMLAKT